MKDSVDCGRWPDVVSVRWDGYGMTHHSGPLLDKLVGVTFAGRWLDATTFETHDGTRLEFPPAGPDGIRRGCVVYLEWHPPAARGSARREAKSV